MTAPDPSALLAGSAALAVIYAVLSWFFPGLLTPLWRLLLRAAYRFRAYNAATVPAAGPALIVCNHVSYLDWMVLWAACPRPVRFVLRGGHYRHPALRALLSWARHRTLRVDDRAARPNAACDALDAV